MYMNLEEFDEELRNRHMEGHWEIERKIRALDPPAPVPHRWKWDDIRTSLEEATSVVDLDEHPQGARQSIMLDNPGLQPTPGLGTISDTISVGFQMVSQGDNPRTHRHTATAFRFVIDGQEGAYTTVNGERFPMLDHDLIMTPALTWHDHINEADEPVIWMDGLDASYIANFGAALREAYKEDQQRETVPQGYHRSKHGLVQAAREEREPPVPYRYAWSDVEPQFEAMIDQGEGYDPDDGFLFEYASPLTGEPPTQPSLSLRLQRIRSKDDLRRHRHNSTEVYLVLEGDGRTVVGDETLEWSDRDTFVVTPDEWHEIECTSEEATLFVVSDEPIFEHLNIHTHEAED